jgi:hypothetical protein
MISALPYAMKYCQSLQFYLKAYENEWKKPKQFFEKNFKTASRGFGWEHKMRAEEKRRNDINQKKKITQNLFAE